MTIPILIITYNRFDFVLQILEKLHSYNCKNVYLSVDHYQRDIAAFEELEQFLIDKKFDYKILKWQENIGCEHNVMKGTKWFFDHVSAGIILEDDCLPTDAFFEFIKQLNKPELSSQNISFFSTTFGQTEFYLQPVYLPIFWGWYTHKDFFNRFYDFLFAQEVSSLQLRKLWKSEVPIKTKLIALLNYLSFEPGKKGVSWDSVLFYYQLVKQEKFLMPSVSFIDNLGFGNLNSSFTHTSIQPTWYNRINICHSSIIGKPLKIIMQDSKKNNEFLQHFYKGYPGNYLKLSLSIIKSYQRFKKRHR